MYIIESKRNLFGMPIIKCGLPVHSPLFINTAKVPLRF